MIVVSKGHNNTSSRYGNRRCGWCIYVCVCVCVWRYIRTPAQLLKICYLNKHSTRTFMRVCAEVNPCEQCSTRTCMPSQLRSMAPCRGVCVCERRVSRSLSVRRARDQRFRDVKPISWPHGTTWRPRSSLSGHGICRCSLEGKGCRALEETWVPAIPGGRGKLNIKSTKNTWAAPPCIAYLLYKDGFRALSFQGLICFLSSQSSIWLSINFSLSLSLSLSLSPHWD
jgi:hypothetical protein